MYQMVINVVFGVFVRELYSDSTQNCSEDNFCIDYYCMQSSQQDWLVHWQRKRLKWWKRVSQKQFTNC